MADIMKILQQAQQMQGRLKQIQDELEARTVNAASGGIRKRFDAAVT